ncbi:MAG: DNA starvation/stationary phase protection protein Dps [Gemmatimonadales bacterium]
MATATASRGARLFKTKNDLPEDMRSQLVNLLNERLADGIDLQSQLKQAHWNLKGPNFIALHELFDEIHAGVTGYVDTIAERAVQLGGKAEGTIRLVAERSEMPEYPPRAVKDLDHAEAIASALAAFGERVRRNIDEADELGDKNTADLFTEVSRGTDKWLWFVEAHLEK